MSQPPTPLGSPARPSDVRPALVNLEGASVAAWRFPVGTWIATIVAFLAAYGFMFSVVHVNADTRPCIAQLPDPLFHLIPHDRAWYFVSHEIYYVFNASGTLSLAWTAWRGNHRPALVFLGGLAMMAVLRSATITLLPLCKATVAPGEIPLETIPTLNLGFARIPWLMWATNDLIFSGHVGEFLLLTWVTRHWPTWARVLLIVFQVLQVYALLATRGHYTVDVLLALPCTYFAYRLALGLLVFAGRPRPARA